MAENTLNTISMRVDASLKRQAEDLFDKLGLNMTTAVNVFLRQAVRQKKIPFEISLEEPNPVTVAAMKEAEKISKSKSCRSYKNAAEMLHDVLR